MADTMREIETDWGRMAWRDTGGEGLPLLLLHGTGCDNEDWGGVLGHIEGSVRCVATEFRGHGDSSVPAHPFTLEDLADDALLLLEHLELERALLVGHSLGGMAALAAARRSSRAAGLVLLEGWVRLSASATFGPDHHYGGLAASKVQRIVAKSERTRARFDPDIWNGFWRSVEEFDAWDFLATTAVPIVEVLGDVGRVKDHERLLGPANPAIRWAWVAGAGHYLPHERPHEVARICLDARASALQQ